MAKMEVDDVVDLSLGPGRDPALTITPSTVRDLRALAQNAGLTITPAPAQTATSTSASPVSSSPSTTTASVSLTPASSNHVSSSTNAVNNIQVTAATATTTSTATGGGTNNTNDSNAASSSSQETNNTDENKVQRRVLRPRTEPKSYAEAPDIVLLPARMNGRQQNGNIDSETDDEEMPPYVPIKELTPAELKERENGLRKLREDLRNEETKLVLLKKLKQSQHVMKENLGVTPTTTATSNNNNPLSVIPAALTSKGSLSVTPTTGSPLPAHSSKSRSNNTGASSPAAVSIR